MEDSSKGDNGNQYTEGEGNTDFYSIEESPAKSKFAKEDTSKFGSPKVNSI